MGFILFGGAKDLYSRQHKCISHSNFHPSHMQNWIKPTLDLSYVIALPEITVGHWTFSGVPFLTISV